MKNRTRKKRYIFDPLYGIIRFEEDIDNFIWKVITSPELQRLREVRLCNINSLYLTGGANINRFEHALGTLYLAYECINSWPPFNPITKKEQILLLLAALLHDIASAPFGHSIEYIESREGFSHEGGFEYIIFGEKGETYRYKSATLEPIFFGMPQNLLYKLINDVKLTEEDVKTIGKFIRGEGRFGPLINGTMDLDNIDNVFRLAYHIGIVKSGKVPLELARSLWIENGKLTIHEDALPLVEEWCKVRKKLYSLLLLNPEEFAAKCMLTEAVEIAKAEKKISLNWYDTDYELLKKLMMVSSETREIISRLMIGELYGCIGIFSSTRIDKYSILSEMCSRRKLEKELTEKIRSKFNKFSRFRHAIIVFHPILDVNKTERRVRLRTNRGKVVNIGKSSKRLLIGVFFKNRNLNIYELDKIRYEDVLEQIRREVYKYLSGILEDKYLREVELYDECKNV